MNGQDGFLAGFADVALDLDLLVSCAEVEAELRQREWEALELLLSYHREGDTIEIPTHDTALTVAFVAALVTVGWNLDAPA
jgi:hypothetical protein